MMAKSFLTKIGVKFTEIEYHPNNPQHIVKATTLKKASRHPTFPQVFVGPFFIGGYTELVKAYKSL